MTIVEYLDSIKARLLTDPMVSGFHVIRERAALTDGYLRPADPGRWRSA